MPRRGQIAKRDVLEDPIYNSKLVTRLINNVMVDGKKGVAQKIVYGAFDIVAEKTGKDALEMFQEAMDNVMPVLEVKARRSGRCPHIRFRWKFVRNAVRALGLRWITKYSRLRNEKTMKERLAGEILDALNNTGGACKSVTIHTRWQKQTRRLHTTAGKHFVLLYKEDHLWLEIVPWKKPEISVSWLTSMPGAAGEKEAESG